MEHFSDRGNGDLLLDRRWLKRQVVTWRTLALIAMTVLATVLALRFIGGDHQPGLTGAPHIARLAVTGVIQTDQKLLDEIDRLTNSANVLGVILRLDSPGGSYAGSEALYSALTALSSAKPTVAVIDGVAASGAYMAAIASNHIVARAGSITGSVGVIMQMPNLKGLLDHIGVGFEAVRSAPLKATPNPFEETSSASREAATAIVQDLFSQFVGLVATRRQLAPDQMELVRSGRIFTGNQALPLGLIDAIGGEAKAMEWLRQQPNVPADVKIIDASPDSEEVPLKKLIEQLTGTRLFGAQTMLDGPLALWQPSL